MNTSPMQLDGLAIQFHPTSCQPREGANAKGSSYFVHDLSALNNSRYSTVQMRCLRRLHRSGFRTETLCATFGAVCAREMVQGAHGCGAEPRFRSDCRLDLNFSGLGQLIRNLNSQSDLRMCGCRFRSCDEHAPMCE